MALMLNLHLTDEIAGDDFIGKLNKFFGSLVPSTAIVDSTLRYTTKEMSTNEALMQGEHKLKCSQNVLNRITIYNIDTNKQEFILYLLQDISSKALMEIQYDLLTNTISVTSGEAPLNAIVRRSTIFGLEKPVFYKLIQESNKETFGNLSVFKSHGFKFSLSIDTESEQFKNLTISKANLLHSVFSESLENFIHLIMHAGIDKTSKGFDILVSRVDFSSKYPSLGKVADVLRDENVSDQVRDLLIRLFMERTNYNIEEERRKTDFVNNLVGSLASYYEPTTYKSKLGLDSNILSNFVLSHRNAGEMAAINPRVSDKARSVISSILTKKETA